MKTMKGLWLVALLATTAEAQTASQNQVREIAAADAKKYVGQQVTVCGPVVTYDCDKKDGVLSLDLISPYWEQGVSVAISREDWSGFGAGNLAHRFLAASVCATGTLERARKRLRIPVRRPDQLEVTQPSPVRAPEHATAILLCQEGVQSPVLKKEVKPNYSQRAMEAHQEGRILLDTVVLPDGSVSEVRVVYGLWPDYGLNMQAIEAVSGWQFSPGTLAGRAVPVVVVIEMWFFRK